MKPHDIVNACTALIFNIWCILDVILYKVGGDNATISYNLLRVEVSHPIFGYGLSYTFGTAVGHFCCPKVGPDITGVLLYIRLFTGLLPILGTLLLIGFGPVSTTKPFTDALQTWGSNNWRHVPTLVLGFLLGLLNGMYMVEQHPLES